MHRFLLPAVLLALLALAAMAAVAVWTGMGDTTLGVHGWIALGLGVFFTLAIGGGLMALVFYSSRHGYDDAGAGDDERR